MVYYDTYDFIYSHLENIFSHFVSYDYWWVVCTTVAHCHGRNETHVWLNLLKPDLWLQLDRKYIKLYKIYKFVKYSQCLNLIKQIIHYTSENVWMVTPDGILFDSVRVIAWTLTALLVAISALFIRKCSSCKWQQHFWILRFIWFNIRLISFRNLSPKAQ